MILYSVLFGFHVHLEDCIVQHCIHTTHFVMFQAEISATDKDTLQNGPPFQFWTPCGGGCPCPENPACEYFEFDFIPSELPGHACM